MKAMLRSDVSIDFLHHRQQGSLPDWLGLQITDLAEGRLSARMQVRRELLAPNGYLHAASVIGLADSSCGYACLAHLPPEAKNFTTIELKSNFLGTCTQGWLTSEAVAVHLGRSTQIWDATVRDPDGRTIALFRCTQMVLY